MRGFEGMPLRNRWYFFLGLGLPCWLVSVPATWLGYQLAGKVPEAITLTLVMLNPLFFLLTFVEIKPLANRLAIFLGGVGGPLIYLLTPDYALLVTGLCLGTLAYIADRIVRSRSV